MATAAAIVARARRDVISHFMERNAVSSDAAVRWVPERHIQRRMLARLIRRGVLVETGEDTYFLDVPAYDRWRRSLRLRTVVLLAGVAVVGAAFAALA
jgi:CTP-dependent riboflavin kinase